jgi:hypothetical protein
MVAMQRARDRVAQDLATHGKRSLLLGYDGRRAVLLPLRRNVAGGNNGNGTHRQQPDSNLHSPLLLQTPTSADTHPR